MNSSAPVDTARRSLLLAGAAAPLLAGLPAATHGRTAASDRLVVNALGTLFSPHYRPAPDEKPPTIIVETRPGMVDEAVIADAIRAGLSAVTVTIGHVAGEVDPFEHTIAEIGRWDAIVRRHAGKLTKVLSTEDIRRARPAGKVGVIYGTQNSTMLGDRVERVDILADLGMRVLQLTYNTANAVGGGSMADPAQGLTAFGRTVVARANACRLMVDLSHSNERTCLDAIAQSARPVTISHSGCRALGDSPRNKTDAELRQLAERGGFFGVYFMPLLTPGRQAMAEDVIAHIEHAVKICGEDHVGIGTDGGTTPVDLDLMRKAQREYVELRRRQGIAASGESGEILFLVPDLYGVDQFRTLADRLQRRGHPASRIDKILGANYVRVAREIWGEAA